MSDSRIRDAVRDALVYDPRVTLFDVTPEVSGGVVTLRGKVDNLKARRAAGRTAQNTVGVVRVVNRIKVRPEPRHAGGQAVRNAIESAFIRDPYIRPDTISVTVRNGVVDLVGTIGTFFEKKQAEDLASRVRGVVAVNNYLVVAASTAPYSFDLFQDDPQSMNDIAPHYGPPMRITKTDQQIREEIEDEFFWSPFVDGDAIHVTVHEGKAILTGTVDSLMEYNAARGNAYEGGASFVDNQLVIR